MRMRDRRPRERFARRSLAVGLLGLAVAGHMVLAEDATLAESPANDAPANEAPAATREADIERARAYFSDVVLINQHGEPMRFYSDLLHGKSVVISPFFTTCDGVCPVLGQKLVALQNHLGDRLGRDVHLLSISVDPENDTTPKLKDYAERMAARPGWYFLSGTKENVDWVLSRLGQLTANKEGHSNVMIMGNEPAKAWRKVFGLDPAASLIQNIDEILASQR